jgi:hypothetical protein
MRFVLAQDAPTAAPPTGAASRKLVVTFYALTALHEPVSTATMDVCNTDGT